MKLTTYIKKMKWKNLKIHWKKLGYWKKGMVIGGVIGIILLLITFICKSFVFIWPFWKVTESIFGDTIFREGGIYLFLVIVLLQYIFAGLIIGSIIATFQKKEDGLRGMNFLFFSLFLASLTALNFTLSPALGKSNVGFVALAMSFIIYFFLVSPLLFNFYLKINVYFTKIKKKSNNSKIALISTLSFSLLAGIFLLVIFVISIYYVKLFYKYFGIGTQIDYLGIARDLNAKFVPIITRISMLTLLTFQTYLLMKIEKIKFLRAFFGSVMSLITISIIVWLAIKIVNLILIIPVGLLAW